MVILDCNTYASVEEYIQSLSKRARHELTLIKKRNPHVIHRQAEFDRERLKEFMQLWERQLVRGQPIQWAYPSETVFDWYDQGELLLLEAVEDGKPIAMHFLKKEDGFWEAGPPMWQKDKMKDRHMGTLMWFHMAFYGIENKIGIINFGGGVDNWREMIRNRKNYRNPLYKWRFIPQAVKTNPDSQPNYSIVQQHGKKVLILN